MATDNTTAQARMIRRNGLFWASQKVKRTQVKGDILQQIIEQQDYANTEIVQRMKLTLNRRDFSAGELKMEFNQKFPDLSYEGFYLFPFELAVLINFKKIANNSK